MRDALPGSGTLLPVLRYYLLAMDHQPTRRQALASLAGGMLAGAAGHAQAPKRAGRPNIVIIMADDMGFSDIGCYGGEIDTPNLNRIAQKGMRFTQFYNTARCCPTRASLLTGLYAHQAGIGHMMEPRDLPGYRGDLSPNAVTIAEALKPSGYKTYMCGKWHVTPLRGDRRHNWPLQRGFDKFYGTLAGAGNFFWPAYLMRDNTPIESEGKDYYYTDALSENAANFIGESAKSTDPFFLYLAYTAPHWPLHAPEREIEKYKGRYKDGWDALRVERHKRMVDLGIVDKRWPLTQRDSTVPAWADAKDKDWHQRRMEVYAAMVDRMDQGIGKVLAKLKETGAEDNTLVLFLADNGGCAEELGVNARGDHVREKLPDGRMLRKGNLPSIMPGPMDTHTSYGIGWANASNTPFRMYKHWVHEGGISSPLIAHWPSVIKQGGQLTNQTGHLIDLMATAVDVGQAKYPKDRAGQAVTPLEGKSLAPILAGKKREGHKAIFWEHEGNRAIRQGDWKLVSKYPGSWELYDLAADRTELNDLSAKNPKVAAGMAHEWQKWAARAQVEPWEKVTGKS